MTRTLRSCLLAAALIAATTAATGCTDRTPMPASVAPRVAAAIDLGPLAPDTIIDLVLGVRLRAPARLQHFLAKQPDSRDVLTASEFADAFAVSPVEYAHLSTWLQAHGLTITRVAEGRTTVSARGSVAAVEAAFGTRLHDFVDADGRFYAAVQQVSLPADVAGSVSGVAGIEGGLPWRSHLVHPQAPPAGPFGAVALESLYQTSGIAMPGQGQTVVILGAGNPPTADDVANYYATQKPYGLSSAPSTYTIEKVGGENRDDASLAENERQENTLDVQMIAAMAPYANIVHVLTATNTPGLFADGIAHIVNDHKEAHAVSVSYGTCERGAASAMPVVHAMLAQAKAQGQTWFFAAGDTGTDGCRAGSSNKILSAGWPASAPWAVGVGGTQINDGTTEVVWDNYPGDLTSPPGAGGGGVSESVDKPAYQVGVTFDDGARDEPDVAALAGPPNIAIYLAPFGVAPVNGTSAATPMWAGVWALLSQAKGITITDSLEHLYMLGKAGKGFHDIVSGNNGGPGDTKDGGYPAKAGYDLATGWGSPNTAELIANW